MLDLDVTFGQMHVHLCHIQAGMAENQLERHHIPSVHQILDGERVTQQVRAESGDAGCLSGPFHHMRESVVAERSALHG